MIEKGTLSRRLGTLVAGAGALVALAGCEYPVTEGFVYQKTHIPQHSEEDIAITSKLVYPEQWRVTIVKCPQGELPQQKKVIYRDCESSSYVISKEAFDELHVGQYYKIPPNTPQGKILHREGWELQAHRFSFITKPK